MAYKRARYRRRAVRPRFRKRRIFRRSYRKFGRRFRRSGRKYSSFRPNSRRLKMTYVCRKVLTMDTSGAYEHEIVFRGNSVYDPEYATGGNKTNNYDQVLNDVMYTHYRVIGAKIEVVATPLLYQTYSTSYICLTAGREATVTTLNFEDDFNGMMSRPLHKWRVIQHNNGKSYKLSLYVPTRKIYGPDIHVGGLGADKDNNPAYPWYFNLVGFNPTATGSNVIAAQIKITYYTIVNHSATLIDNI